ncbi:translation initiation factor IF-2-like [Zalophus californianus]|uniref:Translation initiation factor IF-2-like n=1 Tax=Zalophus californianus TaxID=9704 RepID=A0A6P9FC21_ZALCA|nr:translation initiation factor IF-2-like [Zalophus californianus]
MHRSFLGEGDGDGEGVRERSGSHRDEEEYEGCRRPAPRAPVRISRPGRRSHTLRGQRLGGSRGVRAGGGGRAGRQRTAAASARPDLSARCARWPSRSSGSPLFSHSARPPGPRAAAARTSDAHGHSPQCRRLEILKTTTIPQGPPLRGRRARLPWGHPATPSAGTQHRRAGSAGPSSSSTVRLAERPPGAALRAASSERKIKTTPRPPPSLAISAPHNRQPRASGSRGRRKHAEGLGAEEHRRSRRCKGLPRATGPAGGAREVRGLGGCRGGAHHVEPPGRRRAYLGGEQAAGRAGLESEVRRGEEPPDLLGARVWFEARCGKGRPGPRPGRWRGTQGAARGGPVARPPALAAGLGKGTAACVLTSVINMLCLGPAIERSLAGIGTVRRPVRFRLCHSRDTSLSDCLGPGFLICK